MSGTPTVEVRQLRKSFLQRGAWPWSPVREVAAIKGVDLQVQPGQVMAVVGQSGSGKTTLARIILGLEEASSGEILIEGRRWDQLGESERHRHRVHYQYVPQDAMSALDPQQTAIEHVAETLRVLGGFRRAEARQRAEDMLTRLGLKQRFDALPREMSGGEQRRVTLARVLALEPRLVVADEPTSGLDPDRRDEVLRDLIGNLPEEATCLLVTHNMAAARTWCTDAIVMLDGWVIETFDPRNDAPVHPYSRLLFDPWSGPLPRSSLAATGCPFQHDCQLDSSQHADQCLREVPRLMPAAAHAGSIACYALASADAVGRASSSPSPSPDAFDEAGAPAPVAQQPPAQG